MTTNAPRPIRPIGQVRVGTPMLLGVVLAITVPVTVAYGAVGGFSHFHEHTLPQRVSLGGPMAAVQITGVNGDVEITGDPQASGITGTAVIGYHETATMPQLRQSVVGGVATLGFVCPGGSCDGDVTWHVTVPAGLPVTAVTSNASVTLTGLTGRVDATSSNGGIDASHLGSGNATFHTSNAGVTAQFDGAPQQIMAKTSNGGVDVFTDGKTPAFDVVQVSNGSTDESNVGRYAPDSGRMIIVETTNGGVTIR